jgi:small subunit ribosomal protein S1
MTNDKPDTFASLFESETQSRPTRVRSLSPGDRVRAEVVRIGRDAVFVEILDRSSQGRRQQSYLKTEDLLGPDGQVRVKIGEIIEAVVLETDPRSGEPRLGTSLARPTGLDELTNAYQARIPVEGKVTGLNKGGLEVEIAGLRAFCPISQADRVFLADASPLVGRNLLFLITELRDGGKRVVVSRRAVLEKDAKEAASRLLAGLTPGTVVRGTVSSVRDFGAFVDIGGIEGLIPNTELSYDRSVKATELLKAGDVVDVQVLDIKEGANKKGEPTTKITLSLKALATDPWDTVDTVAPEGKIARGNVTRVVEFGAFVRLAPGIEGLLHISELGGKVAHPSAVLKPGQSLNVVVRSVDKLTHKIALAPAPDGLSVGETVSSPELVVGAVINGVVDRVESYGVVLQIEGTRDRAGRGVIPNAELGTPRGTDNRKLFPVGTRLTAKVIETGEGKLKFSIRAAKEDEERAEFDGFRSVHSAPGKLGTWGDLLKKKS